MKRGVLDRDFLCARTNKYNLYRSVRNICAKPNNYGIRVRRR